MKRIGKVFTSLKLTDYLLAVLVVVGIIGTLLFFTRKKTTLLVDLTAYPQEFREEPFPPSYIESSTISVGDAEYNWSGEKIAEIKDVTKSEWPGNRRAVMVTAQINVVYNPQTKHYTYNDIPILVGNKLILNTEQSVFTGQIVNVYQNENERYRHFQHKKASVTVLVRDIETWHADALKNFEARNSKGDAIARTTGITITASQKDVETDRGQIVRGYSTITKDALVTMDLDPVYCLDSVCYFNTFVPLKVGGLFWVQSGDTLIEKASIVSVTIQ